jgi:glycerol-3-phosphate O-acyltransferase
VFEKIGLDNVITIAGNNLVNGMKDRGYARKFGLLLRNSGVLFIERNSGSGRSESYLYNLSLEEFTGYELEKLFNVHQYSNRGREKLTNEPDSRISMVLAARKARYILVSAYSFEKIVDDYALAFADGKTKPGTFEDLVKMKGAGNGRVFVNFGKPISSAHYFERLKDAADAKEQEKMLKTIKKEINADISDSLKRLTTFTSTYVLSAAVKQSKMQKFSLDDVLGNARTIVKYAREKEFSLPPELKTDYGFVPEMQRAAGILVERGAMSKSGSEDFVISDRQAPLLKFYAAKIEPTLALAKK